MTKQNVFVFKFRSWGKLMYFQESFSSSQNGNFSIYFKWVILQTSAILPMRLLPQWQFSAFCDFILHTFLSRILTFKVNLM